MPETAKFEKSVFLNCPFDPAYQPLFDAIVFTVLLCDFDILCSKQGSDSGGFRLKKIVDLLADCRFSIHDLSRTEHDRKTRLPRFNMPLELGVELGLRRSGGKAARKSCLVLDSDKYRYQVFLSDIAGMDIRAHTNSPPKLIAVIRDWLRSESGKELPGGRWIGEQYRRFLRDLPAAAKSKNLTVREIRGNFPDYCTAIEGWIKLQRAAGNR